MNILITGGAGFLGLHLANFYSRKGWTVTVLDIAPFNQKEYRNVEYINCDIRKRPCLEKAIKDQDFVIHAAAALPLWKREDIFSVNIEGTKNVISSCIKNKVTRLIYISSTAVYGIPKKHPIFEKDPRVGVGPYGESKIQAENACFRAINKGVPITILRPKTFIGTHRLGVFEILFDWIHDGKRIPVIGSGNNRYQLLDVDDLVEATYKVLISKSRNLSDAFNIGAYEYSTVKQDLQSVFTHAKSYSKVFPTPALPIKTALMLFEALGVSPLYKWVYATADKDSFVSIDKLSHTLKWKPAFSNAQALTKAYDWYQEHYKEIKSQKSGITHTAGWNQGILGFFKKFL